MICKIKIFIVALGWLFLNISSVNAQKRPIENSLAKTWPVLKTTGQQVGVISPNGEYYGYTYGPKTGTDTIILAGINGDVMIKRPIQSSTGDGQLQFCETEDRAGFIFGQDSLEIYDLINKNSFLQIADVQQFKIVESDHLQTLVVKHRQTDGISVVSMKSLVCYHFPGFWKYFVSKDNKIVYLASGKEVIKLELSTLKRVKIYSGAVISALDVNPNTKDLALMTLGQDESFKFYHYDYKSDKLTAILSSSTDVLSPDVSIVPGELELLSSGDAILFKIRPRASLLSEVGIGTQKWKVWSFTDDNITGPLYQKDIFTCIFYRNSGKLQQLFDGSEVPVSNLKHMADRGIIVTQTRVNNNEFYWNDQQVSVYLYNLKSGGRKTIHQIPKGFEAGYCKYSPGGKYIFWWCPALHQYMSYNLASGRKVKLTMQGSTQFYEQNELPARRSEFGVAAWTPDDQAVLVYDEFDIWRLDPEGIKPARNLTAGQGRENYTKLRLVPDNPVLKETQDVLVSMYNIYTKRNGLMSWYINKPYVFNDDHLGPYCYRDNISTSAARYHLVRYDPVKAVRKSIYLVRRESATQSPNLFLTKDFSQYTPLTNIHPELQFQWYKTKLIEWSGNNRAACQGILYYPEHLDSTKKYPVIIHYYEKRSDELYVFKNPGLSDGEVSIPWYTANGYAVFVPDIHYEVGELRSALKQNMSNAGAKLAKISWIDTANMGIQGHSFGGYETYLLITAMEFKAAQASSGISDLTSYFSHIFMDVTRQKHIEYDQGNMRATPWTNPEAYVKNSPVYFANAVKTPLLIMHGQEDANVPFSQAYEMYAALRRLKKPCWLLAYANEDHNLGEETQLDFTERQQQFFGYYLKGEKKPDWLK